jgi:hypothetical protein
MFVLAYFIGFCVFSLFEMLYSCNSILARIMVPPYEIVSLLQLGISNANIFRNIVSNEVIIDSKFSTFFTVDGLIEMIVFLSDKITRVSKINLLFSYIYD